MLREAVSSIGLTFFPVAALVLFVAVYASVLARSFLRHKRSHWDEMANMALEDSNSDHTTAHHKENAR